jgi:hypothetical protein
LPSFQWHELRLAAGKTSQIAEFIVGGDNNLRMLAGRVSDASREDQIDGHYGPSVPKEPPPEPEPALGDPIWTENKASA